MVSAENGQNSRLEDFLEVKKIQSTGGATLYVTLDKDWASERGIEKGGEMVMVKRPDDFLLLASKQTWDLCINRRKARVIVHKADISHDDVFRIIVGLYLAGCEAILLRPAVDVDLKPDLITEIFRFVDRKLDATKVSWDTPYEDGVAGKRGLRFDIGTDFSRVRKFKDELCRMQKQTEYRILDSLRALLTAKADLAQLVFKSDDAIDMMYLYNLRNLKMAITDMSLMNILDLRNPRECLGYRHVIKNIERVADQTARLSRELFELLEKDTLEGTEREQLSREFIEKITHMQIKSLFDDVIEVFRESIESLIDRNYLKANSVIDRVMAKEHSNVGISERARTYQREILMQNNTEARMAARLSIIFDCVRRMAENSAGIAEITLNLILWEQLVSPTQKQDSDGWIEFRLSPDNGTKPVSGEKGYAKA